MSSCLKPLPPNDTTTVEDTLRLNQNKPFPSFVVFVRGLLQHQERQPTKQIYRWTYKSEESTAPDSLLFPVSEWQAYPFILWPQFYHNTQSKSRVATYRAAAISPSSTLANLSAEAQTWQVAQPSLSKVTPRVNAPGAIAPCLFCSAHHTQRGWR